MILQSCNLICCLSNAFELQEQSECTDTISVALLLLLDKALFNAWPFLKQSNPLETFPGTWLEYI